MALTDEQRELIKLRIKEHTHPRYTTDILLDQDVILKDLVVYPDILRPEKTSALYFARFLFLNKDIYKDKEVIDMGCGCGIQGILMATYGAHHVLLSDIFQTAVQNTIENIKNAGLESKTSVTQGDLFETIDSTADVIIFNHPFFPAEMDPDIPVTGAMCNDGELIHRFFDEAPRYLNEGGILIMPFFDFAGEINNPEIQGMKHGYTVRKVHAIEIDDENIQKGGFLVYELKKS
ncbi:MAG: hypothetical protein RLY47_618 [Candidatus Parcubacteria bacterium]|jgi:methylase of polypeptide subunit release factors